MRKIFHFFCCMVLFLATSQLSATSFDVVNTGSNMTVFVVPPSELVLTGDDASLVDSIGIFYTNDSDELVCAGSAVFNSDDQFQITLWGSEDAADNGMAAGEALTWKAKASGGASYEVTAGYKNGAEGTYALNKLLFVNALDFTLEATASEGCVDENATNYDEAATIQEIDVNGNSTCIYTTCDDIPDVSGCIYADAYAALRSDFTASQCTGYGGEACSPTVNVTFQVDMSGVDTHADGVYLAGGGFGQEGHLLTDNGSDVWSVTLALDKNTQHTYKFRNQPALGTWDGFEATAALIEGGCNTGQYNDRFVDVAEEDITLDVVAYGSCTAEAPGVSGCMAAGATNYNEDATIQTLDQYGNLECTFASCDAIPDTEGCFYATTYAALSTDFTASACVGYGGTACEEASETPAIDLPIDFESEVSMETFGGDDAHASTTVDPVSAENNVGMIIRDGGDTWQGAKILVDTLDFSSEPFITMDVYTAAPVGTVVKLKLEGVGATEVDATTTVSGAWETLSWDFNGQPSNFNKLVLMFDFGAVGDSSASSTFYFDDIAQFAPAVIPGCMDVAAENYNSAATESDDSCTYTPVLTSSPVPTEDASTVLSIFSDAYTSLEGTDFNPNWGQGTTVEVSEVLTYTGLNYQGTAFANQNVSAYTYLHVDYFVMSSTGLNFFLIGGGETPVALDVSTVGEWVSVEIPLTDFTAVNLADVYQFKVDGNGDVVFDTLTSVEHHQQSFQDVWM